MQVETAKLAGNALDWVVAEIEEVKLIQPEPGQKYLYSKAFGNVYCASRAEAQGWNIAGPIITRKSITIAAPNCIFEHWSAFGLRESKQPDPANLQTAQTALTAAMRCFVAMERGDFVEIPDVLADCIEV